MSIKIGINGYGRIGRNVLRAVYESDRRGEIEIVAVNDLGDANTNAHLTRHDTAHGRFPGTVEVDGDTMIVNGDKMRQRDVAQATAIDKAQREYIQSVAGSSGGTADELAKLAQLRDQGVISADEFQAQKTKLLA